MAASNNSKDQPRDKAADDQEGERAQAKAVAERAEPKGKDADRPSDPGQADAQKEAQSRQQKLEADMLERHRAEQPQAPQQQQAAQKRRADEAPEAAKGDRLWTRDQMVEESLALGLPADQIGAAFALAKADMLTAEQARYHAQRYLEGGS